MACGEAAELGRWGRCSHRLCTHVQTLLGEGEVRNYPKIHVLINYGVNSKNSWGAGKIIKRKTKIFKKVFTI